MQCHSLNGTLGQKKSLVKPEDVLRPVCAVNSMCPRRCLSGHKRAATVLGHRNRGDGGQGVSVCVGNVALCAILTQHCKSKTSKNEVLNKNVKQKQVKYSITPFFSQVARVIICILLFVRLHSKLSVKTEYINTICRKSKIFTVSS